MSGIADLIERLEKLEGPDRACDLLIHAIVGQPGEWSRGDIAYALTDIEGTTAPPAYTASLDAATALVERVLPGWDWTAARSGQAYGGYVYPLDFSPSDNPNEVSAVHRANAATALILALLRALQQEDRRCDV